MAAPTITITDHAGGTSGDLNIEIGQCAHFECVSGSTLGVGEWTQAKPEWSINDNNSGSLYKSGIRGFNFSHYFTATGTFTVTCTVTNADGFDVETRTVVVGASTRSTVNVTAAADLKTVFDANGGNNKEFVLQGDVACSAAMALGTRTNIVFRSLTPGTPLNVDWTGSGGNIFDWSSGSGGVLKDLHIRQGGVSRATTVVDFGVGGNIGVIDCEVDDVCSGQMLNCFGDPKGILIQDTATSHDDGGQCIWAGNTPGTSRMLAVYGGSHTAGVNNSERPFRGAGMYVSHVETYFDQQNGSNSKEAMSINGVDFGYYYKSEYRNSSSSGTGNVLIVGHTSGTTEVTQIVFDRVKMNYTNRLGIFLIAPNTSIATHVMFRNCLGVNCFPQTNNVATDVRIHHCTWASTIGLLKLMQMNTGVGVANMIYTGNLGVWSSNPDEVALLRSVTNTVDEIATFDNNVAGTGTSEDMQLLDAVTGNKSEFWVTTNARANFSGNLRKTVAVDGSTYRPDTDDTDLVFDQHPDMDLFLEDYYGNPRTSGSFIVGAVDAEGAAPSAKTKLLIRI